VAPSVLPPFDHRRVSADRRGHRSPSWGDTNHPGARAGALSCAPV